MIKSKVFTEEQVQFILDHYKGLYSKELRKLLNKEFNTNYTLNQVAGFTSRN